MISFDSTDHVAGSFIKKLGLKLSKKTVSPFKTFLDILLLILDMFNCTKVCMRYMTFLV